jgi:hypothetical protein
MKLMAIGMMAAVALSAQWLRTPTPDVPRTADGKPDLGALAPKAADGHPDLSGVWMPNSGPLQDLAVGLQGGEVPYQPWAAQLTRERANGARGKDDPAAYCIPGMPKLIVLPYPYKIMQQRGVTVILYEGFTTFRQIFTDGRELPKDPQPPWMDNAGRPHTDALHTIGHYPPLSYGTMDVTLTIDDPKAYTRPWTVDASPSRLVIGQDLLEYVCTENNKDVEHLFGDGRK